tara:strand:+ start:583 stop:762 length:180 start_codon:yes stop_codon:yes gene_type:complete
MIEDFMYVLKNYPNIDLSIEAERRVIADALWNYMRDRNIIVYSDLEAHYRDKKNDFRHT